MGTGSDLEGLAGIVMLAGAAIWLVTKPWLPRVSNAALGVTCLGLGVLAIFTALYALQEGVFEATPGSRIVQRDYHRADDPWAFWALFCMFAVPGLLLVAGPIWVAIRKVRKT